MSEKSANIEFLYRNEEANYGVWNLEISGLDEHINIKFFNLEKEKSDLGISLTPIAYIPSVTDCIEPLFTRKLLMLKTAEFIIDT